MSQSQQVPGTIWGVNYAVLPRSPGSKLSSRGLRRTTNRVPLNIPPMYCGGNQTTIIYQKFSTPCVCLFLLSSFKLPPPPIRNLSFLAGITPRRGLITSPHRRTCEVRHCQQFCAARCTTGRRRWFGIFTSQKGTSHFPITLYSSPLPHLHLTWKGNVKIRDFQLLKYNNERETEKNTFYNNIVLRFPILFLRGDICRM